MAVVKGHEPQLWWDGINNAAALARASIGIAKGGIGSDAAIETADVGFMTDDLSRLPWLTRHSRRALKSSHRTLLSLWE